MAEINHGSQIQIQYMQQLRCYGDCDNALQVSLHGTAQNHSSPQVKADQSPRNAAKSDVLHLLYSQ